MLKVIMLKGLPGCGKSTWAKELMKNNPGVYKRVNKDDLRLMLDDWYWTGKNEEFTLITRDFIIISALIRGFSVIVDDTNLHPKHEQRLREIIKQHNETEHLGKVEQVEELEIKDMTDVPLEVCVDRDRKRLKPVGYKIIRDFYFKYLAKPLPKPVRDPKLPDAIISDLDGTLALFEGKRSPYDASTCDKDDVNELVADILRKYREEGVKILFVSGRKDKYKEPTIRFLDKAGFVPGDGLWMRPTFLEDGKTEDNRKDWIIKTEIYNNHIKGKYNIRFVLDDRDQVVQLCWRALGLTCLQVADGDF